ncbi:hypothetical protein [Stutzerimonas nitrititolerans]|uniref:hypothetical protein n=1 Tax=Stutzerimonas nitrititolerans TaxID=2482751 RepID=UPI0028B0AA21|nr:hypothetical protein [Stutzerimonas nitrititolerans]
MNDKTGGPVFPSEGGRKLVSGNEIRKTLPSSGMTLRDYFAAKAISTAAELSDCHRDSKPAVIARHAYAIADAMLAARTK